jgi:hypothetical protein
MRIDFERLSRFALPAALLLGIARLWIAPLGSSLVLDETGTYWTIQGGWAEIAARTQIFQQSALFGYIVWISQRVFGLNEFALRLPSVLAMAATLVVVYRLGTWLIGREAATLGVLLLLISPDVAFEAADARPYALALFSSTLALLMLVRWFDTGKTAYAAGYALSAAAAVHFHVLFAVAFPVHLIYAWLRLRHATPVTLRGIAVVTAAIGALLLPLKDHVAAMAATRASHVLADKPGIHGFIQLFTSETLGALLLCVVAAVCLMPGLKLVLPDIPRESKWLLLAATAIPAIANFAASRITGSAVFLARYMLCIQPPLALLMGYLLCSIRPAWQRNLIVAGQAMLLTIAWTGMGRHVEHAREGWRDAAAAVNRSENAAAPVMLSGSFVESKNLNYLTDPRHGYVLAPFAFYPVRRSAYALPIGYNAEAEGYVDRVVTGLETERPGFILVERQCGMCFRWQGWIEARLKSAGFTMTTLGRFSDVMVYRFRPRSSDAAESSAESAALVNK